MNAIIIGFVISFIITLFLLPVIIKIAENKKLFVVKHYRKVHKKNTSSLGGIAIFSGVLFTMLFFSDFISFKEIRYYMAAGSFIFLVGLRDDLHQVKPSGKLFGQVIAAAIIIFLGKIRIEYFDSWSDTFQLPYWGSVLLTILIIIWFINAYNFFDGIDLQAALLAIVILIPAAFWFFLTAQYNFSLLLFSTAAALIAFLFFNYSPSKIFMGDTGTVTIGFITAFSFIKFVNLNCLENLSNFSFPHPFLLGMLIMQLPFADSIRVITIRILRKKSPFIADKNHFHHLLLKLKWSHPVIAGFSALYTFTMMLINVLLFKYSMNIWIISMVNIMALLTLYSLIYRKIAFKKKSR